jgi:hypothetical protein
MRHAYSIISLPVYGCAQIFTKRESELKFLASTFSLHITYGLSARGKDKGQLIYYVAKFICKLLELV